MPAPGLRGSIDQREGFLEDRQGLALGERHDGLLPAIRRAARAAAGDDVPARLLAAKRALETTIPPALLEATRDEKGRL